MVVRARLKREIYRDSVELMRLAAEIGRRDSVHQFSAMMATPANLELMRASGLLVAALEGAGPNDLCLAVEAESDEAAAAALAAAETELEGARRRPQVGGGTLEARSLRGALAAEPTLNLALISVPGQYAALEARRALRAGLHVMLFSDNVPLEQEVELKALADRLGLLCLGPDCGTALIGGLPLGFANRVRRGSIGLVGASGTGLQTVTCQIHQLGGGVSHALGVGGRDLSAAVGGRATLAALRALASEPGTEVLVVLSKPGDPGVEERVLAEAVGLGRPLVVHLLGRAAPPAGLPPGVVWAGSLAETGLAATALARGDREWRSASDEALEAESREVAAVAGGGFLAGLFAGGTLASEAGRLLLEALGRPNEAAADRGEVARVGRHRVVDLGDDRFTVGRPHPIIDPTAQGSALERAVAEGAGLVLLDVILGYGAHPDPAGALRPLVERAHQVAAERGRSLQLLASVVGTDQDPQSAAEQRARLVRAGVRVYETPTRAARVAAAATARLEAASTA